MKKNKKSLEKVSSSNGIPLLSAAPRFPFFPHILRKFAAFFLGTAVIGMWLLLYGIVLANFFSDFLLSRTTPLAIQYEILKTPFISHLHQKLGQHYLSYNLQAASREYGIASELQKGEPSPPVTQVLGVQTSASETWESITTQKESLAQEADFWEQVLKVDSNYRHALIRLSTLYYTLDRRDEGVLLLKKLEKIAPFDQNVTSLRKMYGD